MAMDPARRKHLQRMYVKLLDSITDHNYQRIVDELHSREILSRQMKEKILIKQGSDQLRELLDILPKRGNAAFDEFYEVLVECEEDIAADILCPERSEERKSKHKTGPAGVQESQHRILEHIQLPEDDELPEKWPDSEAQVPMNLTVTKVADIDVTMKERFRRAQSGDSPWYAMYRPARGIFLLIANMDFTDARANGVKLDNRDGTSSDVIALKNLFKQLGFCVKEEFNCSADKLLKTIQEQAALDHTNYNCFACAVLTHGERGVLYGVDGEQLPVDDFKNAIDGNQCPTLMGKPRLFFIQACQGTGYDPGAGFGGVGAAGPNLSKSGAEEDKETDKMADKISGLTMQGENKSDAVKEFRKSAKSDVYTAMATLPDYVSWRNTLFGTWFVQAIAYVFSRFSHKYTLDQLMTKVNRLVSKAETKSGMKQVSNFHSSMISDFYFFPGLEVAMPLESHSEPDLTKPAAAKQPEAACMQQQAQVSSQQPPAMGSGFTAQPTDGLDGDSSRLVE